MVFRRLRPGQVLVLPAEGFPVFLLLRLRLRQLLLGLLRLGLGELHPVEVLEVARNDGDRQREHQYSWSESEWVRVLVGYGRVENGQEESQHTCPTSNKLVIQVSPQLRAATEPRRKSWALTPLVVRERFELSFIAYKLSSRGSGVLPK